MENITIIGTSHISKESIDEIKKAFVNSPDIVCVELDIQRFHALASKQKQTISLKALPQIGLPGFLFALIGRFVQKKLGSIVGIEPGSEMLEAVKLAGKNNSEIFFIDRPIQQTLKGLKKITWKERFRFVKELLLSPFSKKQEFRINLSKVPERELITIVMEKLKKDYPTVYKVLVHDRNKHMARNLYALASKNPDKKILAVVGAGHKEGMNQILEKMFESPKFETL